MNTAAPPFDVCVRGTGAVGSCLALALSRQGLRVALQGAVRTGAPPAADVRAYALNAASMALLQDLRIREALPADAVTAVVDMHVEGDEGGSVLEFSAWQQGVEALAWIVDAAALDEVLATALGFAPHVQRVEPGATVKATLTAVCEGKASASRELLGAGFEPLSYGQQAVATRVRASRPHDGMAHQWFRAPDVLALLPLDRPEPGRSYAVVWSLPEARAQELLAAEPAVFEAALDEASGGAAGELRLAAARAAWPLMLARARRLQGPGWALLGDAAHVVHPLAGQGLNLGLADVSALSGVISAREPWRGLGDERLLVRYARQRRVPTAAMAGVTDGLLQLFAHPSPLAKELRNRGLNLLDRLSPVKRWLAARALGT